MNCPACDNECPRPSDRHKNANCIDCYVGTSDTWDEEARKRLCDCYAVNHKKENLKGYKPLDESILKLIEEDKSIEKNQIAKEFQQNKIDKEYNEQIKYAEDHPRVELDE